MEPDSHSLFDRLAIAFGAMILGYGAGLVMGIPLLFLLGAISSSMTGIGSILLWKVPVLLGLVSGIVGFVAPGIAADGLGKIWKGVVHVWRVFGGG